MSKSSSQQLAQHVIIALLALAAVLLVSGCTPEGFFLGYEPTLDTIVIRCDPETKKLQTYAYSSDSVLGTEQEVPDAPLSGHPCSESTELQGRPFSIVDGKNSRLSGGPINTNPALKGLKGGTSQATTTPPSATSQVDLFSSLMPLLFGPAFPTPGTARLPAACDVTNHAFIVNHLQNSVTAFGICPLRLLKEIPVASNPLQVALTPDGSMALVTSFDGALVFIDAATYMIKTTLDLSNYSPSGIAISPDGTRAYLTNYIDTRPLLLVIDIPNRKLLTTIPLQRQYPRVVTLTPDGSQAWVNYYNDVTISIVDLQTNTIGSTLSFNSLVSRGIAFNPQGTKAFVAVQPDQLYVVDTMTLATIARITVGNGPNDVIMMPQGDQVAVGAEYAPGTWWIDARRNQLIVHSAPAGVTSGGTMGMAIIR